jgi:tRNA C32,U32 (ribose-2'-O)-methylase TrmJ
VNRLPEPRPTHAELAPYDLARHALQARIELAKERLFADLDEAQKQLRRVAATTARDLGRRAVRAALIGGALMLGLVAALVLRRQQKRLRIVWK